MKVTDAYDEQSDSWYFFVTPENTLFVSHHTHELTGATVNLADGTVLGIEIV